MKDMDDVVPRKFKITKLAEKPLDPPDDDELITIYDVDGTKYTAWFRAHGHGDSDISFGDELATGQPGPTAPPGAVETLVVELALMGEGPQNIGDVREWTLEELRAKADEYGYCSPEDPQW